MLEGEGEAAKLLFVPVEKMDDIKRRSKNKEKTRATFWRAKKPLLNITYMPTNK